MKTLDDRERWLDLFARAAFGSSERRLWVWTPPSRARCPTRSACDPARVTTWEPVAPPPPRMLRPKHERVLDRARQGRRVAAELVRIRARRLRAAARA